MQNIEAVGLSSSYAEKSVRYQPYNIMNIRLIMQKQPFRPPVVPPVGTPRPPVVFLRPPVVLQNRSEFGREIDVQLFENHIDSTKIAIRTPSCISQTPSQTFIVNDSVNGNDTINDSVKYLINNPLITYEELATQMGKSRRTIFRIIKQLQEKGIVERIGSDKKGCWKINIK